MPPRKNWVDVRYWHLADIDAEAEKFANWGKADMVLRGQRPLLLLRGRAGRGALRARRANLQERLSPEPEPPLRHPELRPHPRPQEPPLSSPQALALIVIAFIAWRLFLTPHQIAEAPSPQVEAPYTSMLQKLKGIKVGDVDIGEVAASAVNNVQSSLQDVKDEATAKAALPKLNEAASQFDQLTGLLDQMPPETRKVVAETFAAIRPTLDQLMDKALAIPGVGAVIKPAVDAIRAKLETLATAQHVILLQMWCCSPCWTKRPCSLCFATLKQTE